MWEDQNFEATLMPCAKAPNIDAILYHTSFGGGPGMRFADIKGRMQRQAESLRKVQEAGEKPVVVAIRPATTEEGFEHSIAFQEHCWKHGLATYPSVARAGNALARLLEWQSLRQ